MHAALLVALLAAAAAGALLAGMLFGRTLERRRAERPASPQLEPRPASDAELVLEALLRQPEVGVLTLDAGGHVTRVGDAAYDIFEIGVREPRGRAIIELVRSIDLDRRVRDALAGHASRGSLALTSVNAARTLRVTVLPFERLGGALVVAIDQTTKVELERTRQEFVSNVSHELRTPLAAIKLMVETLLAAPDDPDARAFFLPQVHAEVDRVIALIEDLLELARTDEGTQSLRRERVDLADVVEGVLRTLRPRAERARIELTTELQPGVVLGDADRLTQVVINLVDNALKHTPSGGRVAVAVGVRERDVALVVRDTGEGIPFNDLPRIFERFYVVDRSRSRETGGTGLGLSIVKLVVEAHGGEVTAESELGAGSTFICRFPHAP